MRIIILSLLFLSIQAFADPKTTFLDCKGQVLSPAGDNLRSLYLGAGGILSASTTLPNFYLSDVRSDPKNLDNYRSGSLNRGLIKADRQEDDSDRDDDDRRGVKPNRFSNDLKIGDCQYLIYLPHNLINIKDGEAFTGSVSSSCRATGESKTSNSSIAIQCSKSSN